MRSGGDKEEAVDLLVEATQLRPDDARLCNTLGVAYAMQDEVEKAVESFRRATEIEPDFAEAYRNLGVALQKLGRLEEAESYLQGVGKRKLARVYDAPFLLAEQARLARARGQKAISKRLAEKAAESFASLGMQRRSESDLLAEPGSQFKLAPRQRRILRELLASEEAQLAGGESAG